MSLAYIRILALRIHRCTLRWRIDTYVADQCTWKLLFVYNLKHSVEAKFEQCRGQPCIRKWHILNAYSLWRICLGLSTSNLWGKKDNFNEWMQYNIHFNAFILKSTESTDHSLQNWKSLLIETVRWIDSDFIALIYISSHVVSFVVMEHVVHLFEE